MDLVVVLGAGRLGLLVAFVAERLGTRVLAIARADGTLERARSFGIETSRAGTNVRPRVLELTGGRGADVVVEATGTPAGLGAALALVRPCGTLALKSTPGQPVKHFDLTSVVVNEVRLQGSRCGSFPDALAFRPAHPMPLANLVTARLPLEEIGQAFERALEGGKVIVEVQ